jgi:hypothetical protein
LFRLFYQAGRTNAIENQLFFIRKKQFPNQLSDIDKLYFFIAKKILNVGISQPRMNIVLLIKKLTQPYYAVISELKSPLTDRLFFQGKR